MARRRVLFRSVMAILLQPAVAKDFATAAPIPEGLVSHTSHSCSSSQISESLDW